MPDNSPANLEAALKEIADLNLSPERQALLQAELFLISGEANKAIEALKKYTQNNAKLSQQSQFNFDKFTKIDKITPAQAEELRSSIAASVVGCGECPGTGGLPGKWIWISPTKKICKPC